jgi:sulfite reductase beta subunit-like hemoprotein
VTTTTNALTAEEEFKAASDHLRGDLARELRESPGKVSDSSGHLLKFHGIYAQDNRDVRRERALAGETLDYIFMIRVAIPGGRLTPEQWLALDTVARRHRRRHDPPHHSPGRAVPRRRSRVFARWPSRSTST